MGGALGDHGTTSFRISPHVFFSEKAKGGGERRESRERGRGDSE